MWQISRKVILLPQLCSCCSWIVFLRFYYDHYSFCQWLLMIFYRRASKPVPQTTLKTKYHCKKETPAIFNCVLVLASARSTRMRGAALPRCEFLLAGSGVCCHLIGCFVGVRAPAYRRQQPSIGRVPSWSVIGRGGPLFSTPIGGCCYHRTRMRKSCRLLSHRRVSWSFLCE